MSERMFWLASAGCGVSCPTLERMYVHDGDGGGQAGVIKREFHTLRHLNTSEGWLNCIGSLAGQKSVFLKVTAQTGKFLEMPLKCLPYQGLCLRTASPSRDFFHACVFCHGGLSFLQLYPALPLICC